MLFPCREAGNSGETETFNAVLTRKKVSLMFEPSL